MNGGIADELAELRRQVERLGGAVREMTEAALKAEAMKRCPTPASR